MGDIWWVIIICPCVNVFSLIGGVTETDVGFPTVKVRDQNHICTRLRRDVSQLSINASFFKFPLTEADVKFGLVKFC
jgi:hypothetical protein